MANHAMDRAMERFGLGLTASDMATIIAAALERPDRRIGISHTGSPVYQVRFRDEWVFPVIVPGRQSGGAPVIATFLSGRQARAAMDGRAKRRKPKRNRQRLPSGRPIV